MRRVSLFGAVLALALGCMLPPAWAAIGRDQAASLALQKAPGRVLAVEHGIGLDNRVVWRVRIVTPAGELRVVELDADTGRFR